MSDLRALVEQWRAHARAHHQLAEANPQQPQFALDCTREATVFDLCADDLEAALRASERPQREREHDVQEPS